MVIHPTVKSNRQKYICPSNGARIPQRIVIDRPAVREGENGQTFFFIA